MSTALNAFTRGFAGARQMKESAAERQAERELKRQQIEAGSPPLVARGGNPREPRSMYGAGGLQGSGRQYQTEHGEGFWGAGQGVRPSRSIAGAALPSGSVPAYIRSGLINRGMRPEIADAFLMNFQDESGFDADITEGAPNVHGTRGRGLYQLTDTKPGVGRRSDYERWAKARGDNLYGVDSQLDFLMHELSGSESGAWKQIQQAGTTGEAAAMIVRKFLRPAKEHQTARAARYLAYDRQRPNGRGFTVTPGADRYARR